MPSSGQTPIHVPLRPKRGQDILPWAQAITEAIQRLRDRKVPHQQTPVGGSTPHPFRISTVSNGSTWDATVATGQIHYTELNDDGQNDAQFCVRHITVPDTTLKGLNSNTTYGFWIKATIDYSVPNNYDLDSSASTKTVFNYDVGTVSIVKDTTHTSESQTGAFTATSNGFAYSYIGQVSIVSNSVTVTQTLNDNFTWPNPFSLNPWIVSNTADNELTRDGTDGGAWYQFPAQTTLAAVNNSAVDTTYGTEERDVLTDLRSKFDLLVSRLESAGVLQ